MSGIPLLRSVRSRVAWHLGCLVIGTLLIAVGSMAGIERLHADADVAARGYEELRQIYDAGLNLVLARSALHHEPPNLDEALRQLELASGKLSQSSLTGPITAQLKLSALSPDWTDEQDRAACRAAIATALLAARHGDIAGSQHAVDNSAQVFAHATVDARTDIAAHQAAADTQRRTTLAAVAGLSVIVLFGAIIVGIREYHATVDPLDRLGTSVRKFSSGQLHVRSEAVGDREFVALATDFNRMAAELESFYQELQSKVQTQSQALARSQRLASVGYLAAGVSHEINNPLSIITGYAERTLRLLDRPIDPDHPDAVWAQVRKAMVIVCEEAFRCKAITSRLLSMASPGEGKTGPVSLVAVARGVVNTLAGLPICAEKSLSLETPDGPSECFIEAREGEVQQVVLNLTLNALQAVLPRGYVTLRVGIIDGCVELTVSDDGRGMSAQTLERVFEPFYSEMPASVRDEGERRHGSGLGLSITHAIVMEHGGTIEASSAGVGRGSMFRVMFDERVAKLKGFETSE